MAWYNFWKKSNSTSQQQSYNSIGDYRNMQPIINESFDGEKTDGELGSVRNVLPDFLRLRLRAFAAEIRSDIVKIITGKFFKWVVGNGLKIQVEPNEVVLKSEGISVNLKQFRNLTENRFRLFCKSKRSDYSHQKNLHKIAVDAFKTSFLGGDCLVILRVEKGEVKVQLIDGEQVKTPHFDDRYRKEAEGRGNIIRNGIEINDRGEHISYYVLKESKKNILGEFQRVEARGKSSKRLMAWMIYGTKHRIDHVRGIPAITAILEKVEKLDRYTEATVGGAEERAKILYAIQHDQFSTGENPLAAQMAQALGKGKNAAAETSGYNLGEKTAKAMASTTGKSVYNLPIGAKLSALHSNAEVQYEPFWKAIFYSLCASVDMPPEVALQAYNSNYSASRAAQNGWGFIVNIYRERFSEDFYQPIYDLWLELEVLKNKIEAPQYLKAIRAQNFVAIEAYSKARFIGNNMPHIDPLKEVKAISEMIELDIISREQGAESLNLGDWNEIYKKILTERKTIGSDGPNKKQVGEQK